MRLECTDGWDAEDANIVINENGSDMSIFSGSMALMQPQDMRQYIYILTPKNPSLASAANIPGGIIPLGRLDISWKSSFGEPGRLLTSMLSRRIPLAPVTQPVSAVPSHLKRAITTSVSSRPRSPSGTQSRSETPPGHRPNSPSMNRPSITSNQPQSPQQISVPTLSLPDPEAYLLVRHIPREDIIVEKGFTMALSVVLSSCLPAYGHLKKRKLKLAIQHIRPRKTPAPPVSMAPMEAFSPRLPSSGFSTPSSSTITFNYALAHQKILAASNRPPNLEHSIPENVPVNNGDTSLLPPPYFESGQEDVESHNGVSYTGPSAVILPDVIIDYTAVGQNAEGTAKVQIVQDFELPFIALRKGFSTVGGLRILLVGDQAILDDTEDERGIEGIAKVLVLKEYDVVNEVWVAA